MLKFSTGLRNLVANNVGWRHALANGRLRVFSGAQPSTADDAQSGTLLAEFTVDATAFTAETRATVTVQVTGGGGGTINTVKVGGFPLIGAAVAWDTDVNTTAAALAAAINAYGNTPGFVATVLGDTVTIHAPLGMGAAANGLVLATTKTTVTTTDGAALASGVTAGYGLNFDAPVAGVLSKVAGEVWQADPGASGTAGWFRYVASGADDGLASTTFARYDGSIATAGADINLASTAIAVGTPQTINQYEFEIPAYEV